MIDLCTQLWCDTIYSLQIESEASWGGEEVKFLPSEKKAAGRHQVPEGAGLAQMGRYCHLPAENKGGERERVSMLKPGCYMYTCKHLPNCPRQERVKVRFGQAS